MSRNQQPAPNLKPPESTKVRQEWPKELPNFCDAAGTISVAAFGARRLPELEQLWTKMSSTEDQKPLDNLFDYTALKSTGCKTSSRHLRRRATSHIGRKRHRYPEAQKSASADAESSNYRWKRRKPAILALTHSEWHKPIESIDSIPEHTSSNWMATHVWHAKRFHMLDLWGWKIPVLHTNRGAKAAFRLAMRDKKTLLHDATWTSQPIWFRITLSERLAATAKVLQRLIPDFNPGSGMDYSAGRGVLYQLDKFPFRCVGPISWIVSSRVLFEQEPSDSVFIYFFVHPAMRSELLCGLKEVREELKTENGPTIGVNGGLARLQLRGKQVCQTLQAALRAVPATITCSLPVAEKEDNVVAQVQGSLLVVSNQPANSLLPCNFASSGVDVFCRPGLAKDLFLALVLAGACPIGVVELTHIALEVSPPMPVFPRDFPDTPAGIEYWKESSGEWHLLRLLYEGGTGRVKLRNSRLVSVPWNSLATQQANDTSGNIVMIRGSFGQPIADALLQIGSGNERSVGSRPIGEKKRRKRRKSRDSSIPVIMPTPESDTVQQHRDYCNALQQSLSLPACMLVSIYVHGEGILRVGQEIASPRTEDDLDGTGANNNVLGFVTAAVFSHTRGKYCGLAVVGTYRLLGALKNIYESKAVMLVNSVDRHCACEIHMKVHAGSATCSLSFVL